MAAWLAVDKDGKECIYADKKPLRGKDKWGPESWDYLLVDTKHGVCVIHAESCPCNKKK